MQAKRIEAPSPLAWFGLAVLCCGLLSLALVDHSTLTAYNLNHKLTLQDGTATFQHCLPAGSSRDHVDHRFAFSGGFPSELIVNGESFETCDSPALSCSCARRGYCHIRYTERSGEELCLDLSVDYEDGLEHELSVAHESHFEFPWMARVFGVYGGSVAVLLFGAVVFALGVGFGRDQVSEGGPDAWRGR